MIRVGIAALVLSGALLVTGGGLIGTAISLLAAIGAVVVTEAIIVKVLGR